MTKLIFVYNADSGMFNTLSDMAHKIFSPNTYECQLCQITHGNFSMRDNWKEFMAGISLPVEYLHRDEYESRQKQEPECYPKVSYPCVLKHTDSSKSLSEFISSSEINRTKDVKELSELISEKIKLV